MDHSAQRVLQKTKWAEDVDQRPLLDDRKLWFLFQQVAANAAVGPLQFKQIDNCGQQIDL